MERERFEKIESVLVASPGVVVVVRPGERDEETGKETAGGTQAEQGAR